MSKELEALNYIKGFVNERTFNAKYDNGDIDSWHFKTIGELFPDEFKIIETALKRNIELEKANIKLMKENTNLRERPLDFYTDVEKKLKAFETIKEKEVNISALLELDSLQQYNDYCDMVGGCKKLTQEEFEILKEVLL